MILSGAKALPWFAKPDPSAAAVLLYGPDAMRVAIRRQELIKALVGPEGEAEMRLTRMQAGELRKDPAALLDALKAQGFFAGHRVVFLADATDSHAPVITAALSEWQSGDAQLIVVGGALKKGSKLVKAIGDHPGGVAIAIYADPPSRAEITERIKRAGIKSVDPQLMDNLEHLAQSLDPGEFSQTLEKLALFKGDDTTPVTNDDLAQVRPASTEAELDDILNIVTEARPGEIGPVIGRLRAQGVQPVSMIIAATRHFRALYAVSAHPGGISQGIASLRPPVFGPRRDRMTRQAKNWGVTRLEQALALLLETDVALRSAAQTAPAVAVVERTFIRLAMLGRNRG